MLNNTFKKGIFSISKSNIAKLSNRFNSAFSNQLFQIPAKHISTYTFNSEKGTLTLNITTITTITTNTI